MDLYCKLRQLVSTLVYGFFFLFLTFKLLIHSSSKGDPNFLNKDPILDRINSGESFFTRENFLITLGTFVTINVYAIACFIIMAISAEALRYRSVLPFVLMSEFTASLMFAFSNPWLQYGAQIFFFEVTFVICGFAGFWAAIAVLLAGTFCAVVKVLMLVGLWPFKYIFGRLFFGTSDAVPELAVSEPVTQQIIT